ncbi:hypothetical protein BDN72DRAFT_863690 [Pluteus cervinus]|uniref:Uncharacterized protein n=1 Tax=Pluteus cervinus TaxID=181527 RepID=A0ACD3A665_9AGAR|nr:hypothetical protein BDN72DRAFT_863690 [Pluteus cervinus]
MALGSNHWNQYYVIVHLQYAIVAETQPALAQPRQAAGGSRNLPSSVCIYLYTAGFKVWASLHSYAPERCGITANCKGYDDQVPTLSSNGIVGLLEGVALLALRRLEVLPVGSARVPSSFHKSLYLVSVPIQSIMRGTNSGRTHTVIQLSPHLGFDEGFRVIAGRMGVNPTRVILGYRFCADHQRAWLRLSTAEEYDRMVRTALEKVGQRRRNRTILKIKVIGQCSVITNIQYSYYKQVFATNSNEGSFIKTLKIIGTSGKLDIVLPG